MTLSRLSKKQRLVLKWCHQKELSEKYSSIICDGAVRSGKTIVMTVGFIHWAMRYFDGCSFAICGKTITSTERNIVTPMMQIADLTEYYGISYSRSNNVVTVKSKDRVNYFYIFGGKDESSYTLIQGMTLCGVLFDEVALMPRSFVEQAVARTLSVKTAKLWFNCNPDNPNHWFYREWVKDADGENIKNILHIHFTMQDNPILTAADIKKAESMYSGVFRRRYIDGIWVAAEGLVYPMFSPSKHIVDDVGKNDSGEYYVSIDYGTVNPCSMGLWKCGNGKAVRVGEYYFDSRRQRRQMTDEEYYSKLLGLVGERDIKSVIVDPSAASFIECIRRHGKFSVVPAKNNVIDGIRYTGTLIKEGKILIGRCCGDIIREFGMYSWDESASGDCVKKEYDHAMDDMRYFCYTVLRFKPGFQPTSEASPDDKYNRGALVGGWI